MNYLCLHMSSLVDTVSKRCLLKGLLPFVPQQHRDHYYKLIADLYGGLNLDHVHQVGLSYLREIGVDCHSRKNDHSLEELKRSRELISRSSTSK